MLFCLGVDAPFQGTAFTNPATPSPLLWGRRNQISPCLFGYTPLPIIIQAALVDFAFG